MFYLLTPLSTRFKDELLGGVRQEELAPMAMPWADVRENIDVTLGAASHGDAVAILTSPHTGLVGYSPTRIY
jgi:hypothetical protein